uniref:Homeobox domain-containing protein n=1 Tax=Panagrolaimus sp. ES5 TaxID=591445 RepID=A0AC34G9L6_9BILA
LELIEQFFANITSVKHNIDRIPDSEISELCKVDCPNCDTVFPSIWILKKHAKDLHAVGLPLEAVQQFSEKLKQALDDLEEENQIPDIKKQKIEEITNNLKAGKLNGTSTSGNNSKSTKKSSKNEESPTMDSSNIPNLAMMSMLAGSNFPMLMNPFLSMMNPEMLAAVSQSNGSNNGTNNSNNNSSMTTVSSPGCGGDFSALTGQQRRARTKITDDQLKVLKQYFDISNSPTEQQVKEMAMKTGLLEKVIKHCNSPTEQQVKEMAMKTGLLEKVIKHWFRNTLFKERQRDKDSPYNFNVPPQLSIDLDTYEKTGEAKIKPFKCDDNEDVSNASTPTPSTPIQMPQLEIKKEPKFLIKQEPKLSVSID